MSWILPQSYLHFAVRQDQPGSGKLHDGYTLMMVITIIITSNVPGGNVARPESHPHSNAVYNCLQLRQKNAADEGETAAGASCWPRWPGPPNGKQQASSRAGDGPLRQQLCDSPGHAQPIRQSQKSGFL